MNSTQFIRHHGVSLKALNPGSNEYALTVTDCLEALELLKNESIPILGGDVLLTLDKKLIYAVDKWGTEFHYLNWYSDQLDDESWDQYVKRSHKTAQMKIKECDNIANKFGDQYCIAIVF